MQCTSWTSPARVAGERPLGLIRHVLLVDGENEGVLVCEGSSDGEGRGEAAEDGCKQKHLQVQQRGSVGCEWISQNRKDDSHPHCEDGGSSVAANRSICGKAIKEDRVMGRLDRRRRMKTVHIVRMGGDLYTC